MFTYKIVKHEDTENGTLFALYETAEESELDPSQSSGWQDIVVMGQSPVNGVFYESIDELVEHITDLYTYVKQVESGDQAVIDAENVTFVEMEGENCCAEGCDCWEDCDCGDDCDCKMESASSVDADWNQIEKKDHPGMKNGQCCGGNCGCR